MNKDEIHISKGEVNLIFEHFGEFRELLYTAFAKVDRLKEKEHKSLLGSKKKYADGIIRELKERLRQ